MKDSEDNKKLNDKSPNFEGTKASPNGSFYDFRTKETSSINITHFKNVNVWTPKYEKNEKEETVLEEDSSDNSKMEAGEETIISFKVLFIIAIKEVLLFLYSFISRAGFICFFFAVWANVSSKNGLEGEYSGMLYLVAFIAFIGVFINYLKRRNDYYEGRDIFDLK